MDSLSPLLLFGLVSISHVPLPAENFSAFSSYLDCCVWSGLSVFWWSVVPFYCGGFSQWVGLDDWLVKVSPVREACIGVLVRGAGFLVSGVQWSVQ